VPSANTLWFRHECGESGFVPAKAIARQCFGHTGVLHAERGARLHKISPKRVLAEARCQAVTWNRNASDLFAGKWLRARAITAIDPGGGRQLSWILCRHALCRRSRLKGSVAEEPPAIP